MNPKLKLALNITFKNAVNAVLVNGFVVTQWHDTFNLNNWPGALALLKLTGGVIGAREAAIWIPKVLKWSITNADLSELDKLDVAESKAKESETKAKETVVAVQEAKQSVIDKP